MQFENEDNIRHETISFISDDMEHDTCFVYQVQKLTSFENGITVAGTRSYHHYVPLSTGNIAYMRTSEDIGYHNTFELIRGKYTEEDAVSRTSILPKRQTLPINPQDIYDYDEADGGFGERATCGQSNADDTDGPDGKWIPTMTQMKNN